MENVPAGDEGREVVPGRGVEVGTCVVYSGSSESLGVQGWVGKRLAVRLGRQPRARLG